MDSPLEVILVIIFAALVGVLCVYGMHRLWMVWHCTRLPARPVATEDLSFRESDALAQLPELPGVTVQLPMFNERNVAERVITAAAAMDYPRELLQIQVLDDSTDDSAALTRSCCARLAAEGVNVQYIHRTTRRGYKAGALAEAMDSATGEFIAVFDADFVPPHDFLKRTIGEFTDPGIGMVQGRWAHLNRNESLLTRVQALLLDGHFQVEQAVRAATGRWFNFNGTAGIWRKRAIEDAGGWEFDTLTEDTDLSYRAQLAGWKFVYRDDVECPAELPPTVPAFVSQQNRWTKGLIETAIKLLPSIVRSEASLPQKMEAWFHLTAPLLYPVLLALVLISIVFTAAAEVTMPETSDVIPVLWLGSLFFGTGAAAVFYVAALWRQRQLSIVNVLLIPLIMAVCAGVCFTNSKAIAGALLRHRTPFVRTPKFNKAQFGSADPASRCRTLLLPCGWVELVLALALVVSLTASTEHTVVMLGWPFMMLFALGLSVIGLGSVRSSRPSRTGLAALCFRRQRSVPA